MIKFKVKGINGVEGLLWGAIWLGAGRNDYSPFRPISEEHNMNTLTMMPHGILMLSLFLPKPMEHGIGMSVEDGATYEFDWLTGEIQKVS